MDLLDSTLGAVFLGGIAASILYGVTSVQTFIYFQGSASDGRAFRTLIFFLWVLDTIHLAFTVHGLYFYLVSHFGDFMILLEPPWSLVAVVYLTNISNMIVRCVFAQRVSILCGRSRPVLRVLLPVVIFAFAFIVFVSGMGFATGSYKLRTFAKIHQIAPMLYLGLSAAVAADSTVAISLCVLLLRSRTGVKRTDSLLMILMAFSINTGLLTSICALACLITYAVWPDRLIFLGIYFTLSKLYVNSLLASLNGRVSLWSQTRPNCGSLERFEDVGTRVMFVVQATETEMETKPNQDREQGQERTTSRTSALEAGRDESERGKINGEVDVR